MNKGMAGYMKEKKMTRIESRIEKTALEAKYAAEQLEKLYNQIHGLSDSLNDVVMGTITLLMKKGIFTEEELNESMAEYKEIKRQEGLDHKVRSMGYGDRLEISDEESLVLAKIHISYEGSPLPSYPKELYFKLDKTYLFPGLEAEMVGMKLEEEKEFSLKMSKDCKVLEIIDKVLDFKVKVLDIRKKLESK